MTADLAGLYRPTADAMDFIKHEGGYADREISITLRADGTFDFENIPDWWRTDFGKAAGGFDSGSGTWTTAKEQNWWVLELHFADTKRFASDDGEAGLLTWFNLIAEEGGYDVALTVGDADSGRQMRFDRVAE